MKANELMIGDWVQVKVSHTHCLIRHYKHLDPFITDDFEPILLTPEILEKNGFVRKISDGKELWSWDLFFNIVTFYSDNGCPYLTIEHVMDNDISHTCIVLKDEVYNVHELQHALRLCGIEKEIEL